VCDTLCVVGDERTFFAKNSDRAVDEAQVVEAYSSRRAGRGLRTQYLVIPDEGAVPVLGSRPTWLWGFEHGVNQAGVAIGNERVWTVDDPRAAPPALTGMDLVRLGLERGRSADEALAVMTELLEEHGQGGSGVDGRDDPYWSSFLVAGRDGAWVLETSGRTWVARSIELGAAISNRITLGKEWTYSSADVPIGADFDAWRNPSVPTAIADHRLTATRKCVATRPRAPDIAAALRDHGTGPWGAPGDDASEVSAPPGRVGKDGEGVTVCMHVRGRQVTAASMITELPTDREAPLRAWVALGSPCASVYVPAFPPARVSPLLADAETWNRFAKLRTRVEGPDGASHLADIRSVFGPLESELWEEADHAAGHPERELIFLTTLADRLQSALAALGA
jgi:hypothetical protein